MAWHVETWRRTRPPRARHLCASARIGGCPGLSRHPAAGWIRAGAGHPPSVRSCCWRGSTLDRSRALYVSRALVVARSLCGALSMWRALYVARSLWSRLSCSRLPGALSTAWRALYGLDCRALDCLARSRSLRTLSWSLDCLERSQPLRTRSRVLSWHRGVHRGTITAAYPRGSARDRCSDIQRTRGGLPPRARSRSERENAPRSLAGHSHLLRSVDYSMASIIAAMTSAALYPAAFIAAAMAVRSGAVSLATLSTGAVSTASTVALSTASTVAALPCRAALVVAVSESRDRHELQTSSPAKA